MANFSYIDSNYPEDLTKSTIANINTKVGSDVEVTNLTMVDAIATVDIEPAASEESPKANWATNDRVVAGPSGYSANGNPTYGDGKTVVNTTLGTDIDKTSKGIFVYKEASDELGSSYDNLTS